MKYESKAKIKNLSFNFILKTSYFILKTSYFPTERRVNGKRNI